MAAGLLGGSWSPVGWVVCFIQAERDAVVAEDVTWRQQGGQSITVAEPTPFPACLERLEPLESPWTTELLIDCGQWTAYMNNEKNGGDPTAAADYLARRLNTQCVIAMHSPLHGPRHGGTQMWVTGPHGKPPLMYVRTISAVSEDGRWKWLEDGEPLPFEDTARYQARRIRDRLDRALLVSYLDAFDIHADDEKWFGSGVSVRQSVSWPTNPESRQQAAARLQIPAL